MMFNTIGITTFLLLMACLSHAEIEIEDVKSNRDAKVLPIFQVVRFPNDPCIISSGTKNGTCYTAEECSSKGGSNGGSCASGFGVCCTFTIGCGGSSSENCTYFEVSSLTTTGACSGKICKLSSDICQIRLDFTTFVITGPSTSTVSTHYVLNGNMIPTVSPNFATRYMSKQGSCATDIFVVSHQQNVPELCGTLTGEHVFFDTGSTECHDMTFNIGQHAIGVTAATTRKFTIKVSQLSCTDKNLAPPGCTQYYTGSSRTGIETFNYAQGYHLTNQRQTICVRREEGYCRICWYAASISDVDLGGKATKGVIKQHSCCQYGIIAGNDASDNGSIGGYDCLMIPGATTGTAAAAKPNCIAGAGGGIVVASGTTSKTVCSKNVPFRIEFPSDSWEWAAGTAYEGGASGKATKGAKVAYLQTTC